MASLSSKSSQQKIPQDDEKDTKSQSLPSDNESRKSSNRKSSLKGDKKFTPNPENVLMLCKPHVTPINRSISLPEAQDPDLNLLLLKKRSTKPIQTDSEYLAFQQKDIDVETKKCMQFWKAVMERNVEPIKNTLKAQFENLDTVSSPEEEKTETESTKTPSQEEKEMEESKQSLDVAETVRKSRKSCEILEPKPQQIDCNKIIRKMQLRYLNKIQNQMKERNLHKKLTEEVVVVVDKTRSVQSHRKSKSKIRQSRLSIKSRNKEISSHTVIEEKATSEKEIFNSKPILLELNEPDPKPEPPKIVKLSKIEPLVPITDIVKFKTENREYSRWRDPDIKCNCRDLNCTCNKNPNISRLSIPPSRKRLDTTSMLNHHDRHYNRTGLSAISNLDSFFSKNDPQQVDVSLFNDYKLANDKLLDKRTKQWNTEEVRMQDPDKELQEIANENCQLKEQYLIDNFNEESLDTVVLLPPRNCDCEAADCKCPKKEHIPICCICNSPTCRCGMRAIFDKRYITYYRDFKNKIGIKLGKEKTKDKEKLEEKVAEDTDYCQKILPVEIADKAVQFPETEEGGYKVKKEEYCIICGKYGQGCDYIFDIFG